MIRILGSSRSATSACILLLVLSAAACGSSSAESTLTNPPDSSETTDVSSPPAASGDAVTIDNFAFSPAALSVTTGSTVTWTNDQSVPHTVTADDDSFDSKSFAQSENFAQTFDTPGTFSYHCSIHPDMKGSITVEG